MHKTELSKFRKILEIRKTELGNGNRSREALAIEASADELDRIQNASALDDAVRNMERNSDRLHEVESALLRIDDGTFGICASCEEPLNPKRLAAIPWASSCVVCQEAADAAEKLPEGELALDLAA